MTGGRGAAGVAQQAEVVLEALGDLLDGENGRARRRELDGQRHPVQPAAEVGDGDGRAVRDGERRGEARCALKEELDGARLGRHLARGGHGEPADAEELLARDAQGAPAGRDDPQRRARAQQTGDQLRARAGDELAVVKDKQRALLAQAPGDGRRRIRRRQRKLECRGHVLGDELSVGDRGQVHPPRAARKLGPPLLGEGEPQPALPASTRPHEREQPVVGQQRGQLGQLAPAADEARQLGRKVARDVGLHPAAVDMVAHPCLSISHPLAKCESTRAKRAGRIHKGRGAKSGRSVDARLRCLPEDGTSLPTRPPRTRGGAP